MITRNDIFEAFNRLNVIKERLEKEGKSFNTLSTKEADDALREILPKSDSVSDLLAVLYSIQHDSAMIEEILSGNGKILITSCDITKEPPVVRYEYQELDGIKEHTNKFVTDARYIDNIIKEDK